MAAEPIAEGITLINGRDGPNDGFTKVPNEIIEAMAKIGPYPVRIFWAVMRQTYGYQKPNGREITNKTFAKLTGIHRSNISNAKKEAILLKLVVQRDYKNNVIYRINRQTEEYFSKSSQTMGTCSPARLQTKSSQTTSIVQPDYNAPIYSKENFKEKEKENAHARESQKNQLGKTTDFLPFKNQEKTDNGGGMKLSWQEEGAPKTDPKKRLADFNFIFWEVYPKKNGRTRAAIIWAQKAQAGTLPEMETLTSAIEKQLAILPNAEEWPNAESWLNDEKWAEAR